MFLDWKWSGVEWNEMKWSGSISGVGDGLCRQRYKVSNMKQRHTAYLLSGQHATRYVWRELVSPHPLESIDPSQDRGCAPPSRLKRQTAD